MPPHRDREDMSDSDKAGLWTGIIVAVILLGLAAIASYTVITVHRANHPPAAEARP